MHNQYLKSAPVLMQNMKLCTRARALLVEKYGTGTYIIDHVCD